MIQTCKKQGYFHIDCCFVSFVCGSLDVQRTCRTSTLDAACCVCVCIYMSYAQNVFFFLPRPFVCLRSHVGGKVDDLKHRACGRQLQLSVLDGKSMVPNVLRTCAAETIAVRCKFSGVNVKCGRRTMPITQFFAVIYSRGKKGELSGALPQLRMVNVQSSPNNKDQALSFSTRVLSFYNR